MKSKVLHILPSLDYLDAAKQLALLVGGLTGEDFNVHLCTLSHGGVGEEEFRRCGVPVTILGKRGNFDPRALWRLKTVLGKIQPQIVHAWNFSSNAYALAAIRLSRFRPAALVTGYHSVEPWRSGFARRVERQVARFSQILAANSPAVRDFYLQQGLPVEKFRIIPNGVASSAEPTLTRKQLLAELGLPVTSRLIGVISPLLSHKRLKDAIWAADLLKVVRKDVHLLLVGEGPHRARLEKFCRQVQINDHVHFLGERSDISRWLPHLDLLWSMCAYEGQSNSILEAMAAGVPVVASDIPGNRDLVVPDQTGFLVPVGDRAGFAGTTHLLLNDPALAQRMNIASRRRTSAEFSIEKMVKNYCQFYSELLSTVS